MFADESILTILRPNFLGSRHHTIFLHTEETILSWHCCQLIDWLVQRAVAVAVVSLAGPTRQLCSMYDFNRVVDLNPRRMATGQVEDWLTYMIEKNSDAYQKTPHFVPKTPCFVAESTRKKPRLKCTKKTQNVPKHPPLGFLAQFGGLCRGFVGSFWVFFGILQGVFWYILGVCWYILGSFWYMVEGFYWYI